MLRGWRWHRRLLSPSFLMHPLQGGRPRPRGETSTDPGARGTRSCREKGSRPGSFVLQTPPFPAPPAKRVRERSLAAVSHLPSQVPITRALRRRRCSRGRQPCCCGSPGAAAGTRVPVCSLPSKAGFSPRPLSEAAQKCGSCLPPAVPAAKGSRRRGATPGARGEP